MPNAPQEVERTELISDWPDIAFQYYVLARAAKQRFFWYAVFVGLRTLRRPKLVAATR
jgi:hypothetical protein